MNTWIDAINQLLPYVISYIVGHGGAVFFDRVKTYLHKSRVIADNVAKLIDIADDAATNEKIDEPTFQATWKLTRDGIMDLLSK